MQSRQDWDGNNVAGLLNSSPQRRILAQRMPHAIVFIFLPPPPIMAAELKEQLEFSILNQKTSPSSGTRRVGPIFKAGRAYEADFPQEVR
jgi:hypothetical protein